jgi:hypothetical protein
LPDEVAQRFCRDELGITEVLDDKRLAQVPTLTAAVLLPRTLTTSHLLQLQEDEDEIFEVQQDIRGRIGLTSNVHCCGVYWPCARMLAGLRPPHPWAIAPPLRPHGGKAAWYHPWAFFF